VSTADAAALDRAIAHTVADVVTAAIAPGAPAGSFATARDAAQMLALDGLDRALAACAAHAGSALPADVTALGERLGRLAATVREVGELSPLREADRELDALSDELGGYRWIPDEAARDDRTAVLALEVSDVLEDVALAGDESRAIARRSHLPVPVAAAVRAAIDWLSQPGAATPVRLFGEPSLLELRMERIRSDRLYAAHRVIAGAGGNLGPAADGAGWVMRVPTFAERPTYLMLVQGGLRIAVPWHAVIKLRIVAAQPGGAGLWPTEHALLAPLAPLSPGVTEHPVVLIGHGLKRAYLVADRLIWRMAAEPCENEWGTPGGGLRETVRTEDGEVFWVADPARLLADVELPEIAIAPFEAPPAPIELDAGHVEPLGAVPGTAPAPVDAADLAEAEPAPPPETEAPPVARALVADDSLTTRLLLARLLERQGFTVEAVPNSIMLMARLHESAWTVLFTDLELPDGGGPEWLRQVARSAATRPNPVHVVALVRDGGDLDVARAAGVEDTLLKPFARESLAALIARHGWVSA
jgi:CheY-like chemotaxis protein